MKAPLAGVAHESNDPVIFTGTQLQGRPVPGITTGSNRYVSVHPVLASQEKVFSFRF
jgi:hypothetical protein